MPLHTIEQIRAIVGEDGRDLSDEQLLRWDAHAYLLVDVVRGAYRDHLDLKGAAERRRASAAADERQRDQRRVRYERERAQSRRSA